MFYIIKDEKLQIFADDKETLETTLEFMPQLQDERLLETDIITAEELSQHPNKVLIEDIQIEIDVPDYEEQEITKEIEVPDFETVTKTAKVQIGEDEDGNPIYETREWQEEVQTGTHIETVAETQTVQVGSHKEIITVKGLVLNPDYKAEEAQKERERINKLTCTKRVFALMLQELGVDYLTQLKPLIESNPQAQLEWDLCVELLRENPMIDIMAGQLGVTSEQIDALFLYANGELSKDDFELYKPKQEVTDENTTDTTEPDIQDELDTTTSKSDETDTDILE